jgi:bacteriorhodopsin
MNTIQKQEVDNTKINTNIKASFTLTYILLLTTGTITLIEALRTKNPIVRHIFNLETVISIIAGYFYSVFVSMIEKHEEKNIPLNWNEINKLRYIDWSITTPIMLLVLCIALSEHSEVKLNFLIYIGIIVLNFTMLLLGYLGEINKINKNLAWTTSFISFIIMFTIIYINFVQPKYSLFNYILFSFFFVIWTIYGLIYKVREDYRVIMYNILDLFAKCFVGISLWVYFAELFK